MVNTNCSSAVRIQPGASRRGGRTALPSFTGARKTRPGSSPVPGGRAVRHLRGTRRQGLRGLSESESGWVAGRGKTSLSLTSCPSRQYDDCLGRGRSAYGRRRMRARTCAWQGGKFRGLSVGIVNATAGSVAEERYVKLIQRLRLEGVPLGGSSPRRVNGERPQESAPYQVRGRVGT